MNKVLFFFYLFLNGRMNGDPFLKMLKSSEKYNVISIVLISAVILEAEGRISTIEYWSGYISISFL